MVLKPEFKLNWNKKEIIQLFYVQNEFYVYDDYIGQIFGFS